MICRRKRICFSAVRVCVTYRARGLDVISLVERDLVQVVKQGEEEKEKEEALS